MKHFLIILLLTLPLSNTNAGATVDQEKMLADGWYYAQVAYYNYATYISADYTLKLKVKDGIVIIIILNNGGVIHNRINNEGYLYTGGKLDVSKDKKTGKLEYTTLVSISNGRSISSYNISILKEAPDEGQ